MPTYGVAQAGGNATLSKNLTSLIPGDAITLFDGTEAPAAGLNSVAFSRGYSLTGNNTVTYFVSGAPAGTTVDIQASDTDADGAYFSVATITPDASGNGAYSDDGAAAYARARLSAYTTGVMTVVKAQRG